MIKQSFKGLYDIRALPVPQSTVRPTKRQGLVVKANFHDTRRTVLSGLATSLVLTHKVFASNAISGFLGQTPDTANSGVSQAQQTVNSGASQAQESANSAAQQAQGSVKKAISQGSDTLKSGASQVPEDTLKQGASKDLPMYSNNNGNGSNTTKRIDEAKDKNTPQQAKEGFEQIRKNVESTQVRVQDSSSRVNTLLESQITEGRWNDLSDELRRQLYYLRQDFDTLISQKEKQDRLQANSLTKDFFAKLEQLDIAGRNKDTEKAMKNLAEVKDSLQKVTSFLG